MSDIARVWFILAADADKDQPNRSLPRQVALRTLLATRSAYRGKFGSRITPRQVTAELGGLRLKDGPLGASITVQLPRGTAVHGLEGHQTEKRLLQSQNAAMPCQLI